MTSLGFRTSFWCALLALHAIACSSTGVGNPPIAALSLAIVADDEAAMDGDADPAPLARGSIDQAVLVIGSVTVVPCDPELAAATYDGPFAIDLLAGETAPPLPELEIPEGGVCGLDAPLSPAANSAELGGRSLYFRGSRADGLEFILFANLRMTLRLRVEPDLAGGSAPRGLIWAMRPRRWTGDTELGLAQPLSWGNGRRSIVIDADRHPLLLGAIARRLGNQSSIFADPDRNGVLDASERAGGEQGSVESDVEE